MNHKKDFPYHFNKNACNTCKGNCCRGLGGYVWISPEELAEMAKTKKMDESDFSKKYIRMVQGRLSLTEIVINGEYFCCFFDRISCRCTLYEARPKQCKTFPFWDSFKTNHEMLLAECPGVSLK